MSINNFALETGLTLTAVREKRFLYLKFLFLATYDITNDDIERMSNTASEVSTVPSAGDEFTIEKVAKR